MRRAIIGSARASTIISPPRCCSAPASGRSPNGPPTRTRPCSATAPRRPRPSSGAEIAERFWTDQAVQQVSYDRGHLLAAKLDSEIAAASAGQKSLETCFAPSAGRPRAAPSWPSALFRKTLRERDRDRPRLRGRALCPPRRGACCFRPICSATAPASSPSGAANSTAAMTPRRPARPAAIITGVVAGRPGLRRRHSRRHAPHPPRERQDRRFDRRARLSGSPTGAASG